MKFSTVFFVLLIALIIFFFIRGYVKKNKLRHNHLVTYAHITKMVRARGNPIMDYSFLYQGKVYHTQGRGCKTETELKYEKGRDSILIVFNPTSPKENEIIEEIDDFNYYNLMPSDTLSLRKTN